MAASRARTASARPIRYSNPSSSPTSNSMDRPVVIERCRQLAESRGARMLYTQALPRDIKYLEKHGWRRVEAGDAGKGPNRVVAMTRPVDPNQPLADADAPDAVTVRNESQVDATGLPLGSTRG